MGADHDRGARAPRVTQAKTIRLTAAELACAARLLDDFPECTSEADLLRQAALIGLSVLATQASDPVLAAGLSAHDLAARLRYRILPALDFLVAQGMLPGLGLRGVIPETVPSPSPETIVPVAADELGELGTGFIE